jgi:flagellar L-ring protein FlgH
MKRTQNIFWAAGLVSLVFSTGCTMQQVEDLRNVGKPPPMQAVKNPVDHEGYQPISWQPISWPMPTTPLEQRPPGSLWQQGSKSFFKDHRARSIGDILTVVVDIQDRAELDNSTERKRDTSDSVDIPSIYGLQKNIRGMLNQESEGDPLIDLGSSTNSKGEGKIGRQEKIATKVAAVVTQVMPNGNMAVLGSQEIRVNSEIRQLNVQGIVRPEDISSDNTVAIEQLAEARVSYGGQGDITRIQQPRVGQQVLDILSPF